MRTTFLPVSTKYFSPYSSCGDVALVLIEGNYLLCAYVCVCLCVHVHVCVHVSEGERMRTLKRVVFK